MGSKNLFLSGEDCYSIEVIGGRSKTTRGVYFRTEEYAASDAPENPVWKHQTNDRYIFNTGTSKGWRIGKYDHLYNRKSFYASNHTSLIYITKIMFWEQRKISENLVGAQKS